MSNILKISSTLFSLFLCSVSFLALPCDAQVNNASKIPDRIILNPTSDPATSIAVTWRTDTTVHAGFCEWQLSPDTRIKQEDGISARGSAKTAVYEFKDEPKIVANHYSCILNGLKPGSKYVYRVGAGTFWSEWFEFQTPAIGNEPFSFLYFGDPQTGLKSEWPRVLRSAYQHAPDSRFMLYAGDLINRAGRDIEWDEWFKSGSYLLATVPQVMTPGNHDYADLKPGPHWNRQFTLPANGPAGLEGTCYFIDYPNLRLISMDSAAGSELENENGYPLQSQKAWLDSVLSTNTAQWVVVTTHLPFYSTKDSRDNPQLRRHFQPILEKYKVDLVLTGHDHSYGRGRASDNPLIKPSIVYVVSVSGPKLYPAGTKKWMEKSGGNLQLFQKISIRENMLSYQSVTANGHLFDAFRIERLRSGQKRFVEMPLVK